MPVIQMPNGLSVRTYEPPPADFDPLTAPDNLLLHHGFPARPNPQTAPELRKRWERVFSRKLTYIVPTFRESIGKTHGPRLKSETEDSATSGNWSGSVVFLPPTADNSFQWITGRWTVPNPYPSDSHVDHASEWIGIDGDGGSNDVLQAGTETMTTFWGPFCYVWWEWFPKNEVAISSFPVAPGDIMQCLLCTGAPTSGTFYLLNVSRRIHTSFTVTAPSGTSLVGNCAEWIVERPAVDGSLTSLANYGLVYFDEGFAGYEETQTNLGSGTLLTMVGSSGFPLSVPTVEASTSMEVNWEGAS